MSRQPADRALLRGVALFEALSEQELSATLQIMSRLELRGGELVFRQGDRADALYVVVSGRLEVFFERPQQRVTRILRVGDSVGELGVIADSARSASVRALRDSVLMRLERDDVPGLLERFPALARGFLTRVVAQLQESRPLEAPVPRRACSTFALVAADEGIPFASISDCFVNALLTVGTVAVLDQGMLLDGGVSLSAQLSTALDHAEQDNDHTVLLVPPNGSPEWFEACVRQADRTLLLVSQPDPPVQPPTLPEHVPWDLGVCAAIPLSLAMRTWAARCSNSPRHLLRPGGDLREDTARAARRMAARSIGIVLSGGGARAFSHIGVLAGLEDAGVVIDRIGGCSMGALIGALYARGTSPGEIVHLLRAEFVHARPFNDYHVPRVSLIRGVKARRMLERLLGSTPVEDIPRDFFAVSADLRGAELVVHREGKLVEVVGASMSLPGLVPPLERDGRLLVDGGVLENFPVKVMAATQEGPVLGVDAMGRRELGRRDRRGRPRPPSIGETLARATVLSSWERGEEARQSADSVITPGIGPIGLLEFDRIEEVVEAGRQAAREMLRGAGP